MTYATLQNNLRVLHIHDPNQSSTNISLSFQVGSQDNPVDIPGLAHQLEHMLFIGSHKQPKLDQFSEVVSKYDGSQNAYTSGEFTNQIAQVNTKDRNNIMHLLDVLSNMISDPLLNDEYLQKEVNNIQSEQNIHLTNESILIDEAINMQRNKNHPLSFFTCGNYQTLYDNVQKGLMLEVRDVVELFRRTHQTPDNGCLVISSFIEFEKLIGEIENTLGCMKNSNVDKFMEEIKLSSEKKDDSQIERLKEHVQNNPNYIQNYKSKNKLINNQIEKNKIESEEFQNEPKFSNSIIEDLVLIENKSIGKENEIFIIHEIEYNPKYQKNSQINFISNVFHHESFNHFQTIMKNKLKCNNSHFGTQKSWGSTKNIYFAVDLTEDSLKNIESILILQVNQLKQLKNLSKDKLEQSYQYYKAINLFSFDYQQPKRDMFSNSQISNNLLKQGVDISLSVNQNYEEFNYDEFILIIDSILDSKKIVGVKIGNIENFHNLKNLDQKSDNKLQDRIIQLYQNNENDEQFSEIGNNQPSKYNKILNNNEKNNQQENVFNILLKYKKYINEYELNIKSESNQIPNLDQKIRKDKSSNNDKIFVQVNKNDHSKINQNHHWIDSTYSRPYSIINSDLKLDTTNNEIYNPVFQNMLSSIVNDHVRENHYDLMRLGYKGGLSIDNDIINIKVDGFDQQLQEAQHMQLDTIDNLDNRNLFDQDKLILNFNRNKSQLMTDQKNFQLNAPYKKLSQQNSMIIKEKFTQIDEKIINLEKTSIENIFEYKKILLNSIKNQFFLVHGNYSQENYLNSLNKFNKQFDKFKLNKNSTNSAKYYQIPQKGDFELNFQSKNSSEVQNCVQISHQLTDQTLNNKIIVNSTDLITTLKNKVYLALITRLGGNHIFKSLRTEKMIGQVTFMNNNSQFNNHSLSTCIQGNKQSTMQMDHILNEWQKEFEEQLENQDEKELEFIKKEMVNNQTKIFPYLSTKHDYYFNQQRNQGFIDSNLRKVSADLLQDVNKCQMINQYKMMISKPKITIRIVGNEDQNFNQSFDNQSTIEEIRSEENLIKSYI